MGALDVCPFIPVRGVSMEECVLCAQAFGQRLAEELGVPGECLQEGVPASPSSLGFSFHQILKRSLASRE